MCIVDLVARLLGEEDVQMHCGYLENGAAVMLAGKKSLVEENTNRLCTYSYKLTPPWDLLQASE